MKPWGLLATLCAVAGLGACRPAPEIRIGVLASLSGVRRETSGQGTVNGAAFALRELEARGGLRIGGRHYKVVLRVADIGEQADRAVAMARRLINQDSVVALVGPQFSRDAIPVASLAEQARIPMIAPMSSHPATTAGRRYVFRVAYVDWFQGEVMARFALGRLRARRAAVLYDVAGDYNRYLAEVFRKTFTGGGGSIVADEQFTSDQALDFTVQLGRIRAAAPDVVFSPNYTPADSLQLLQARRLGLDATFLGTDSWDPGVLGRLPEARGSFLSSQWHPRIGTAEADSFVARFTRSMGHPPLATDALTYDAVSLLLDAMRREEAVSSEAIRAGLAGTIGFRGVTGMLDYRRSGDPRRSAFILELKDGDGVFVERVDP